jgi:hypothetical protein
MAEHLVFEDDTVRIFENQGENFTVRRTEWKPGSTGSNRQAIEVAARQALAANRAFVASTPTAAQATAQVKALSRQVNGIIRLLFDQLDATD